MLYPTIKQYIDALGFAEDNFDQLANFRLDTEADGSPVMSSGNFAVVFKMQDTRDGSFHALKCFLKDQPGRAEAYRAIADELEQVTSSYLAHIRFLERELFVDTGNGGAEYPVLVMDWVEGLTLDNYLRAHLSNPYALHLLAYQFGRLAAWLLTQPFAHGDLKPDNILVRPDGTLVLVDYDGMFVPAMQGQRAPEMGSPDFRHPDRTDVDFSEHIDDFALASILLSLRAVAHSPDYLGRYGAADRLLLSEADYRSPERCTFLRQEFPSTSAELDRVYALFLLALRQKTLAQVSFRLFNLAKPTAPPPPVVVNTAAATKEEIANGIKDEYGVVYSPDGTKLLECTNNNLESYQVKEGCKVIRSGAFYSDILFSPSKLTTITLPASLTHIGNGVFWGCENLTAITLPAGLTHIGDNVFEYCSNLTAIHIPQGMTEHFKALLPSDLHSKLKELESLPKSPEGTLPENTNIFSKLKLYAAKPKLLEGALSGLFTINANGDKVRFSQGNLQYQASTNIWRFAEHQWDYMGAANSKIGATNSGWIDLFGWGTGNNPKLSSENNGDYNTFVDWGVNAISGGGNAANLWRTLTREEWDYILNARADAAVKMATGIINGVHGLILLPDIWAMPSECSFNARFAGWDSNQYTLSTWAKMEAAGAIFLPATGCRLGLSVVNVAKYGYYWSSTPSSYSKDCAYDMGFLGGRAACMYYSNPRCAGSSVRLVRDSNKILKH